MKFKFTIRRFAVGIGAVTGLVSYYYINPNSRLVYNSWTTNYEPHPNAKWDFNWDRREPESLTKPRNIRSTKDENDYNEKLESKKSKAHRHLILIRHGQYNLQGLTDSERVLTNLGRLQAEYTGKRLQEMALPYTEIIKSTMARAQETGSIISASLPGIPIKHCDFIREGAPIPPEPPVGHWKSDVSQFYQDGSRIEAGFRKYFHRAEPSQENDSYTVIVCHANVIRYFVCRALQFPAEAWLRISLNHGSITWISITPTGRVVLRVLGESGHMPIHSVTSQ